MELPERPVFVPEDPLSSGASLPKPAAAAVLESVRVTAWMLRFAVEPGTEAVGACRGRSVAMDDC